MENKDELSEFDLDDILKEFHDLSDNGAEAVSDNELDELLKALEASEAAAPDAGTARPEQPAEAGVSPVPAASGSAKAPEKTEAAPVTAEEAVPEEALPEAAAAPAEDTASAQPEEAAEEKEEASGESTGEAEAPADNTATMRLDTLPGSHEEKEATDEPTQELPDSPDKEPAEEKEEAADAPAGEHTGPILLNRSAQLHELKKKLIAGPEKLYYDLSEKGVGKLQAGILVNFLILCISIFATTMLTMELVPENRIRLVIFSQILAMLISGLLGCHLMLDGLSDILHGKFNLNTILAVSFAACCADAYFCVTELRVPCCGAFTLEMALAMLARYHRRSTEMAQLDTLRKAAHLTSIVKQPDYYDGKTGILRGEGDVEDFMDTYTVPSGPEKIQNVFAIIALIVCIGIAVLAGILHSISMGVQIFSTSLLVAIPASFFASLTRPAAILEKRLHMVGTVICGWQGVKKLCGRAAFPLTDEDLFPRGSTKLNGIKFYSDRSPDEVVSYTTSLICTAGSGLSGVFRSLLASRSGTEYPVENFRDYGSGGIGGEVCGEPVLVGSLNFLQDMGVEIPQGTMVSQAVYAAIDGQLAAVVAISYAKMRSAAAGLVSLCGSSKVTPVLLAGDFMLTEDFIRSKFSVRTRRLVMPAREVRDSLSQKKADPEADVLALTTRNDLVSSAYAVCGAMALRKSCRLGLFIHLLGGILGMLIMLALAYLGSAELLTPTNVLLYQVIWLVPGFFASEWTRTV